MTAQLKAAYAAAWADGHVPRLIGPLPNGQDEAWSLGPCVFVVPVLDPSAPAELLFAIRARRTALLTGRCPECDAVPTVHQVGEVEQMPVTTALFPHRVHCLAQDQTAQAMLGAHRSSQAEAARHQALDDAARTTKNHLAEEFGEGLAPEGHLRAWAEERLDTLLQSPNSPPCPHLLRDPAQTWNVLMDEGTFRCDSCWGGFNKSIFDGHQPLDLVTDHSCDVCRRYAPDSLQPLVVRLGVWVLRGGVCGTCTPPANDSETAQKVITHA